MDFPSATVLSMNSRSAISDEILETDNPSPRDSV